MFASCCQRYTWTPILLENITFRLRHRLSHELITPVETHLALNVVDDDGGLGSSVVHGRQAVVALLTRGVPDLKLHRRLVQAYRLSQERRCRWGGVNSRSGVTDRR